MKYLNDDGAHVRCDSCKRTELTFAGATDRFDGNDWIKEHGWKNLKIDGRWVQLCPDCYKLWLEKNRAEWVYGTSFRDERGADNIPERRHQVEQAPADEEEARWRREERKTQGRKGCKQKRINMAFSDSNYEFIRTMAKATGNSITEFTNIIIDKFIEDHPDLLQQAREFLLFAESMGKAGGR